MADEWDEDKYRRDRERDKLERAGFVQVGSTTWIAARHVERIELEPGVDEYVQLVSGQQVKIEERYQEDFANDLSARIHDDRERWEQVTVREIVGSVTASSP